MNKAQQKRYESLYARHVNALVCQGKAQKTIEAYFRAMRHITEFYDQCTDTLTQADLEHYFSELVKSHSWYVLTCQCLASSGTITNAIRGRLA